MKKSSVRQSGFIIVDGSALRYSIEGSGIPLVVIGSAVYYPRTFSQRLRENCCFTFVDLRHFADCGGSLSPERVTLDAYSDDIESVCTSLGIDRFVLVGHSHHGNVAIAYTRRYPERVSHLVLIGTPPCDVQRTIEEAQKFWAAEASKDRLAMLRCNQASLRSENAFFLRTRESFIARYVADGPRYWHDSTYDASPLWQDVPVNIDILELFRNFFTDYDFLEELSHLQVPVLSMMGRHDYAVPHVLWDEVLPKLQPIAYHLFEQSGHTPQLEEQELFDQVLLGWLKKSNALGSSGWRGDKEPGKPQATVRGDTDVGGVPLND